jgi:membrane glycosyltransferase
MTSPDGLTTRTPTSLGNVQGTLPGNGHRRENAGARGSVRSPRLRNGQPPPKRKIAGDPHLVSMPEIRRASIVFNPIDRHPLKRLWRRTSSRHARRSAAAERRARAARVAGAEASGLQPGWRRAARKRRLALTLLVLAQTTLATWSLARTFPRPVLTGLDLATVAVFAILWAWISFGFWTAVSGFCVLWRHRARSSSADLRHEAGGAALRTRTAILVPICNEEVSRIFAGVEATYRSLEATGHLGAFDVYVLSDTRDAAKQAAEEVAWAETCRAVGGFGTIFYRHRRNSIKRKSGNIADFLRRWGPNYDYMIVFDADSVMAGRTLVRLVRLMDAHPGVGIIQTVPTTVNRESLFARVNQFGSRVYGPMLAAGLRFWQLGESYYWGHNAILRREPFMAHCGLSQLPGEPPFGGEILSHDFVEGALMGRAGWEVWIVDDLTGSYEETPPTLLDELKRDRRWCQGNLQHLRLLFGDGLRAGHRAIMAMGVMAYGSALLWGTFVLLGAADVARDWWTPPTYFPAGRSLFPTWPEWHPELALALLSTTAVLLFLPKFLAVLLMVKEGETRRFGSLPRVCLGVVLEIVLSTLFAPVRMWFHGKFVLVTLMRRRITWGAQCRDDNETRWSDALRLHGVSTVIALAWLVSVPALELEPALVWWLLPMVVALLLSVPLSVYSSRVSLGRAFRRLGLFLIPEETDPPDIIARLDAALDRRRDYRSEALDPRRIAVAATQEEKTARERLIA